jgi:glycosyltransferase involved in cell wall biosynthesis
MRILFLNHEYPPHGGGAGMAMKHLAEALARQSHEVTVLTTGLRRDEYEQQRVSVLRFPVWATRGNIGGWRTWLSFLKQAPRELRAVVEEVAPEIIHSFFIVPSGFLMAKYSADLPHVTTAVGGDIHDPTRRLAADNNRLVRLMARKAVRRAKFVTACSTDFENRIRVLFPGANVRQIPFPVRGDTAEPEGCADLPCQPDFVIAVLARLIRRKRLDMVIRAVASLKDPGITIRVMGDGPERAPLQRLSEDLGLAEQVVFLGETFEPQKSAYLRSADVFCLTSDYESFGLVYVEAMLQSTPVIASAVSGPSDIVRHGVDGYLVAPGDTEDLAARIRELREDSQQRLAMARQAAVGAQRFSPDAIATTYTELYREARQEAT